MTDSVANTIRTFVVWTALAVAVVGAVLSLLVHQSQQRIVWLDEALHVYIPFAITLALAFYGYGVVLTGRDRHPWLFVLTVAALGIAIGALWEIGEWAFDKLQAENVIKGKMDTMIDLTLDTVGSFVAGLVSLWLLPSRDSQQQRGE